MRLQEDFDLPVIPKEYEKRFVGDSNRVSVKNCPKSVPLYSDGDTLKTDLIVISRYKRAICHFEIYNEAQEKAILYRQLKDNTKKIIMRKTIKTMALMAVLSVAAVGCQKETITVEPQTGIETDGTVYTVRYSVNGVTHTETLVGEQAWAEFLQRMLALAEEGYRVMVTRNAETAQYGMANEVVTFKTKNKAEAYAWLDDMTEQGYFNPTIA